MGVTLHIFFFHILVDAFFNYLKKKVLKYLYPKPFVLKDILILISLNLSYDKTEKTRNSPSLYFFFAFIKLRKIEVSFELIF